jgi:hypothetical protein
MACFHIDTLAGEISLNFRTFKFPLFSASKSKLTYNSFPGGKESGIWILKQE